MKKTLSTTPLYLPFHPDDHDGLGLYGKFQTASNSTAKAAGPNKKYGPTIGFIWKPVTKPSVPAIRHAAFVSPRQNQNVRPVKPRSFYVSPHCIGHYKKSCDAA